MKARDAVTRKFRAAVFLGVLALSACGAVETRYARDPMRDAIIGRNIVDVIQNTGTPSHYTEIHDPNGPAFDRLLVEWDFTNADLAMSVTVPLLVSVQLGGPGKCSMMVTVARQGGIVEDVSIVGAHVDGWAPDTNACGPLVSEDINHPSNTGVPPSFDAFTLLGSAPATGEK